MFRIGDKVRFKPNNPSCYAAEEGATATVYNLGEYWLYVKWLTRCYGQVNGGYNYKDFELICHGKGQLLFDFMYEKV
jgi:hypothetical protein